MKDRSLEGYAASVLLFIVFLIVLLQILVRTFPVVTLVWTEEMSRWVWVWVVGICWGELERSDAHLRMDFVRSKLPPKVRRICIATTDLLYLAVAVNLLIIGIQQVVKTFHATSISVPFNQYVLYLPVPLGLLFVLYRLIRKLITDFKGA